VGVGDHRLYRRSGSLAGEPSREGGAGGSHPIDVKGKVDTLALSDRYRLPVIYREQDRHLLHLPVTAPG
jgi:hypothetical protein